MPKKALITGANGQDAAYLAQLLLNKGYDVYCTYRRISTPNFWRLKSLEILDKVKLVSMELNDMSSISEAIKIAEPDEFYNLAAMSFVGTSFSESVSTGLMDGISVTMILEAIRQSNLDIKFYQASTSEMLGNINGETPMNEQSRFNPVSPYGCAKLYGHHMVNLYREGYKIFACSGILFNHESPLRGLEFVTRRISNCIARIHHGLDKTLTLGRLSSKRDWGFAPEYCKAMWQMLQQDKPDDFVIATGQTHTVKEFADEAFRIVGLNVDDYLYINKQQTRPIDINYLKGDYSKAKEKLGWEPKTTFKELVKIMVDADIERYKRILNGEIFPNDISNYSEPNIKTRAFKG